jgi:hypothetical protein
MISGNVDIKYETTWVEFAVAGHDNPVAVAAGVVTDGDTLMVAGDVYEFTNSPETTKNIPVQIGRSAAETAANLAEVTGGTVVCHYV